MSSSSPLIVDAAPASNNEDYDMMPDAAPAAPSSSASSQLDPMKSFDGDTDINGDAASDEELGTDLLHDLTQIWRNERSAPELLFYETDTLDQVRIAVRRRQEKLARSATSTGAMNDGAGNGAATSLRFIDAIYQMEVDRISFTVLAYHRCRLSKIEKFATYIRASDQTDRLSEAELAFMEGYINLVSTLHHDSLLHSLPGPLGVWLDESLGTKDPCVDSPSMDEFVTFRVKTRVEAYTLTGSDDQVRLEVGDIYTGNWSEFKRMMKEEKRRSEGQKEK